MPMDRNRYPPDWEAIDDSDKDQCLFCEEVRTYTQQYFGDEVL